MTHGNHGHHRNDHRRLYRRRAGAILLSGRRALGFWLTVALGIGGSLVGGVISSLIWKTPDGKFHPAGWIMSIVGACLLLWVYINFFK